MPVRNPVPGFTRHPLFWGEVAAGALLWALYQPSQDSGNYDLAGAGFTKICGPVDPDPSTYFSDTLWRFSGSICTSPGCGTGNQSIAGYDVTPNANTSCARLFEGPRYSNPLRYRLIEQWSRPNAQDGTTPAAIPGRAPFYGNPTYPQEWPVDLPLPEIWQIPGGQPAPTPMPTPYPAIPLRPTFPFPEVGIQIDQRGNGIRFQVPNQDPDTVTDVFPPPSPRPRPQPRPRLNPRGPRPRERERKAKLTGAGAALWKLLGQATEVSEFFAAMYRALPKARRDQIKRENNGFVTPWDKAEALWRYYDEIDLAEAFRQYVREQVTDTFWGRIAGTSNKAYGEMTQSPLGWDASTQHDELLADFLEQQGLDNPVDPGGWFDQVWAPYRYDKDRTPGQIFDGGP